MPPVNRPRNAAPPRRGPKGRAPQRRRREARAGGWPMKLGAWASARWRDAQYDSRARSALTILAASTVGLLFLAIAAAVGVIDDAGRALASAGAGMARGAGLSVESVDVQATGGLAMSDMQRAEAEAIAGIPHDEVLFSVDPREIRDRVSVLPWVEDVTVRRLWPDRVQILVTPRAATALWQSGGRLSYIDATGRVLAPAPAGQVRGLPLVIGAAAPAAMPALYAGLAAHPQVARRVLAAERVGQRRWTLRLRSGGQVLLPADGADAALARLESLQADHRLLDRTFASLDLRTPGVVLIRPVAEAAEAVAEGV